MITGDTIVSYAQARTPEGSIVAQLKSVNLGKVPGLELRLTDLGMEDVFVWSNWKGTRQEGNDDTHDSATLVFKTAMARDAVLYALWRTTDQLFQVGWGTNVLDTRLTLQNLPRLCHGLCPLYELSLMLRTKVDGVVQRARIGRFSTPQDLPDAALRAFIEHQKKENLVCLCVSVLLPEPIFKKGIIPVAMFSPSVRAACDGEPAELKPATLDDFYFDYENEKIILEELLWYNMGQTSRAYQQGLDTKGLHVVYRELSVMHDVCMTGRARQAQELAQDFPGLI